MKVLVDTSALIWWLSDSSRLQTEARAMISDPGNEILVSVVSLWEIAIKVRIGKLQAEIEEIENQVEREGFRRLAIQPAHLRTLMSLPQHHRDPFDHLLIAQAIDEDAVFLTSDRQATRYPVRMSAAD